MVVPDDGGLEQYEVVWILPRQSPLLGRPQAFALEIVDFLGPGDPDERGERTVWVRGRVTLRLEGTLTKAQALELAHRLD